MIITITGKIGSGKTTIAKLFAKELGCMVINVDKLGHKVFDSKKKQIKKMFGTIERNKVGKIVFSDSKKLVLLNSLLHPIIKKEIMKIVTSNMDIVIDAALFYELGLDKISDYVIVVECPLNIVKKRLNKRLQRYDVKIIEKIYNLQRIPKRYDWKIKNI